MSARSATSPPLLPMRGKTGFRRPGLAGTRSTSPNWSSSGPSPAPPRATVTHTSSPRSFRRRSVRTCRPTKAPSWRRPTARFAGFARGAVGTAGVEVAAKLVHRREPGPHHPAVRGTGDGRTSGIDNDRDRQLSRRVHQPPRRGHPADPRRREQHHLTAIWGQLARITAPRSSSSGSDHRNRSLGQALSTTNFGEMLVRRSDADSSFSYGRSHPFHRAMTHVTGSEHPGHAALQQQRRSR